MCQSLFRTPPKAAFEANSVVYEKHESFQPHTQSNLTSSFYSENMRWGQGWNLLRSISLKVL